VGEYLGRLLCSRTLIFILLGLVDGCGRADYLFLTENIIVYLFRNPCGFFFYAYVDTYLIPISENVCLVYLCGYMMMSNPGFEAGDNRKSQLVSMEDTGQSTLLPLLKNWGTVGTRTVPGQKSTFCPDAGFPLFCMLSARNYSEIYRVQMDIYRVKNEGAITSNR
jgi:hypothetical protein